MITCKMWHGKRIESGRTHATKRNTVGPASDRNAQHITSITYFLLREYNKSIRTYETTFIFLLFNGVNA